MKTLIRFLLAAIIATCAARASQYSVTNDELYSFQLFYWTNNAGNYQFSLPTNIAPNASYSITVPTNGPAGIGEQPTNATQYVLLSWSNMPPASAYLSALFTNAMAQIAPLSETVPQTQVALRSYFITGSVPTEQNYWEFIDSMFWYINQMYNNSVVAASNAVVAATSANLTLAAFEFSVTNCGKDQTPGAFMYVTNGVTNVTFLAGTVSHVQTFNITNWFSRPLTNANAWLEIHSPTNQLTLGQLNNDDRVFQAPLANPVSTPDVMIYTGGLTTNYAWFNCSVYAPTTPSHSYYFTGRVYQ